MSDAIGNSSELAKTLEQLVRLGRLEEIDAARVQMLRSMAGALDCDPSNAALWRQYRETLRELMADDGDGPVDQELRELFSPVRDAPPS